MNVKKQLLIFVTLMVLLVGVASATDISNDTTGSDTLESMSIDTPAPEEVAVEEKSTHTMDVEKNVAEQKINKITRDEKTLKTVSTYDVETYYELRDALTNLTDEYITVNIKDNIKLDDYITVKSNITVDSCIYVTINGKGKTIDGDHKHYFLNIAQRINVTINNLTINNCTAAPSLLDGSQLTAGGAIINRDTLILNNTRFNNNHAELYGGAIWNFGTLIVDNTEFNNNTVNPDNDAPRGTGTGGAIYGGSLIVNNTRFNNNHAYTGGAISVDRCLIVDNTEFNDNHANSGGAIHTACTSTVTNSVFNRNTADWSGGAISNGGTLIVNNTQFNNNTAHGLYIEYDEITGGPIMSGGGGSISNGGTGNLTVTNTEFNRNHADNYGGAIDTTAYSNLTITNARFNNNTADHSGGGAIYYHNASESSGLGEFHPHGLGSYKITDTTFNKNTPANFIINQDNYIELKENDNYINVSNIAVIVDSEEIYNGPPQIYYPEIPEGNHLVKLIVNGTNITNNEYILSDIIDVTYQGLIDVIKGATMDITIKLEEGLLYNIMETITLDKPGITITIDGNGQTINGMQKQVFHVNSGSSLVLKNITITNAEADNGGAIYNEGNLTIIDTTLENNTASRFGGAIHNSYGNLTIIDTTLENNQATAPATEDFITDMAFAYGGAIHNLYGCVTITNTTLNNNQATATATGDTATAKAYGGAIHNLYGSVTITDSILTNNQATSTATGNWNVEAQTLGGAIYNTGTLTITDSTLENNQATATAAEEYAIADAYARGGAIYDDDTNNYNITSTSFYKNNPSKFIINDSKRIEVMEEDDNFVSIGRFTIIADGKEIGTGTGIDNLTQFIIRDEYKNVEIVINGTDDKTLNNRYMLRGFTIEVHNYTELVEAMKKAQSENYNSFIISLLPGDYNATRSISWEESETKNLIINGNGLTLDGKGLYQFIKVGTELNLTLTNITITNYKADYGGAI